VADWDGRSYRKVSALQTWLATESLTGVAMGGDERVLDVGCPDGRTGSLRSVRFMQLRARLVPASLPSG
jgi:hypothetical protein